MNFGYCIHFIPEEKSEFHNYTNGFVPHLSIKTHLTKEQAEYYYNKLSSIHSIEVILLNDIVYDTSCPLYSLYYNVKCNDGSIPFWFPKNPHITFFYAYDSIDKNTIEIVKHNIKIKKCILNKVKIVKCDGHYSTWK